MKSLDSLTILFVEDEASHAEIIIRTLQENNVGQRIIVLTDGQQALNFLFRIGKYENPHNSPTPDLILMNLRLPKVNGLEVYNIVNSMDHLKDIPFVTITTSEVNKR